MPVTLVLIASIMLLLYTAYLFIIRFYWKKEVAFKTPSAEPITNVSVIVPFRNEVQNLPQIITCLLNQTYPKRLMKIVLVNDHSEDDGVEVTKQLIKNNPEFQVLNLIDLEGKKAAIKKGIASTESELIITIDADVTLNENWLSHIVAYYENERHDLIILPVVLSPAKDFFQKLQQIDFLNLAVLTGASVRMNSPLMCNGANLCFTRTAYNTLVEKIEYNEIASGDDMFLLLAMKKSQKRIGYFFHPNVVAATAPSSSVKSFLSQRIRWASKTRLMRDGHILFSGLLITLTNLACIILIVLFAVGLFRLEFLLSFILIKSLVELIFLNSISRSFGIQVPVFISMMLSALYPLYVLILPMLILIIPAKWKGRTISLRPHKR